MTQRPSFQDIIKQLSLPDTKLLKWLEEDKSVHPEAATLMADLLCGEELYKDLQARYQGDTQLVLYILKSPNENKNMLCVCVGILATCTTHFHFKSVYLRASWVSRHSFSYTISTCRHAYLSFIGKQ